MVVTVMEYIRWRCAGECAGCIRGDIPTPLDDK